jgi:putative ABC transport system permease protein
VGAARRSDHSGCTAVIDRSLARRWLQTTLLAVFAGLALLLATIGVYGVIAYGVSQRLREFGIRLALGARRQDIVNMVVAGGARMTLIGVGLGLIGAVIAARVIATLLFGVGAWDLISFAAAAIGLNGVAMIACYLPARKAARIDPTSALRTE